MARPERNNVDYFPFLCEEGEKMFYLEQTYGNDGFATFVKILRELARKDYHYINLSEQSSRMFLAAKCRITIDLLESIITDLVMLGKFDKKLWDNKIIWCQDFIDNIQDAYKKRNNNCITYDGLIDRLNSLGVLKLSKSKPKEPVKPHSIVEDTIKKETIKDNIKKEFFELSDSYFEALAMSKKTSLETVKQMAEKFWLNNYFNETEGKNLNEIRRHFGNWLDKQEIKQGVQHQGGSVKGGFKATTKMG